MYIAICIYAYMRISFIFLYLFCFGPSGWTGVGLATF